MQVEDDIGDFDDTQVAELCSKRYKEGRVAKDVLMRCAEDAACKATSEMKAITKQLLQGAAVRDQHGGEGRGSSGETRGPCEGSLRICSQQKSTIFPQ